MKSIILRADKARNLRYSTNAFCKMEEMTGKPVTQLAENAGMSDLRVMLFCGLYWEDNDLTEEKAGDIMDIVMQNHGIDELTDKISKAMELAMGEKKVLGKKKR